MKYVNTEKEIHLGDIVCIGNGVTGVVVCDFDNKQTLEDYKGLEECDFLSTGVMIHTEEYGDIYYKTEDEEITFIRSDDND